MPVGAIELVTKSEYARRRGCSEAAVRRAIKDKRITEIDGKIDPVAADAQWARNTRVREGSRPTDDANLAVGSSVASAAPGAEPTRSDQNAYYESKARREKAEADMAELKLAELQGDLVRRGDIEAVHSRHASLFREALLQLATRVTPEIIGIVGLQGEQAREHEAKIRALLDKEHHQALSQFAGVSDERT